MFSLVKGEFNLVKLGAEVTGIGLIGNPLAGQTPETAEPLFVPWYKLHDNASPFQLMDWHSRISDCLGRAEELLELEDWATKTAPDVSIKFIVGPGGMGKSRLGAEAAENLAGQGWAAGFVSPKEPRYFGLKKKGTLLVIDYPEEHRPGVEELLKYVRGQKTDHRLRILFLTRQSADEWMQLVGDCKARDFVDPRPLNLGPANEQAAYAVYLSAIQNAAQNQQTSPRSMSEEEFISWINRIPEVNHRPLFVVAAAVAGALDPTKNIAGYDSPSVVEALVDREIDRLRAIATAHSAEDPQVLPRLLAMAAVSDSIPLTKIVECSREGGVPLGFGLEVNIQQMMVKSGMLVDRAIPAPRPDILAAALVIRVLEENPDLAPDLLWAALELDFSGGLDRLSRLMYDAGFALGQTGNPLGEWLTQAVATDHQRATLLEPHCAEILPQGLLTASIAAYQKLLETETDQAERSRLLTNLSNHLHETGNNKAALKVVNEAVEIRRRLAVQDSARFEPELAGSLNNQSVMINIAGDPQAALEAIQESVEIYHRLARHNPVGFEPELATSLNSLSNRLSDVGDPQAAHTAIKEAVEIFRRLARHNPIRFVLDLAGSLNNLSVHLSAIGDPQAAFEAIQESVEIYRRLARQNPARFESDLAKSLNNLSNRLSAVGDPQAALEAIQESVEIYRRLARQNPARFEPDLAGGLSDLSNRLSDVGNQHAGLEAIQESVEISRRLANSNPAHFESDLAKSLNGLSNRLSEVGDSQVAIEVIKEAVEIYRGLAAHSPSRFEPELATSLNNLSTYLSTAGDPQAALEVIQETVEIGRRLATQTPARFEPDLAQSLHNLANLYSIVGEHEAGVDAIQETVEIRRRLATQNPARIEPDLATSLFAQGLILRALGRSQDAVRSFNEGIDLIRPYAQKWPEGRYGRVLAALEAYLATVREPES